MLLWTSVRLFFAVAQKHKKKPNKFGLIKDGEEPSRGLFLCIPHCSQRRCLAFSVSPWQRWRLFLWRVSVPKESWALTWMARKDHVFIFLRGKPPRSLHCFASFNKDLFTPHIFTLSLMTSSLHLQLYSTYRPVTCQRQERLKMDWSPENVRTQINRPDAVKAHADKQPPHPWIRFTW